MRVLFLFRNNENLGIEYLSSVLKYAGHKTDLLFEPSATNFGLGTVRRFTGLDESVLRRKIAVFKPDVVAISVYTNIFRWAVDMAALIKKINGNIPVVMGGPHPTIIPEFVISFPPVDYVIRGEGEIPVVKLLEYLERGGVGPPENVPNLVYKDENGRPKFTSMAPPIMNLDSLPFPDKDLFFKFGVFSDRYYTMGSRGCPFRCTYCINHQLQKLYSGYPPIRYRSVDNLIEEIEWAVKRFRISSVYFYDDNFLLDERRVEEFARKYKGRVGLPFKVLTHPNSVTRRKIALLRAAGCVEIDMGIESGSQRIREKIFRRAVKKSTMLESARIIKSFGIKLSTLNIINSPTETPVEMLKTLYINRKIKPSGAHFTNLYPYPGTEVAEICLREGVMDRKILYRTYMGDSNYRNQSLLAHPYKEFGERIRVFGPLFLHLPRFLERFMFYLPRVKYSNIINLIFATNLENAIRKVKEYFRMLRKTRKYYLSGRFLEDPSDYKPPIAAEHGEVPEIEQGCIDISENRAG